jgi:hypothetical protein
MSRYVILCRRNPHQNCTIPFSQGMSFFDNFSTLTDGLLDTVMGVQVTENGVEQKSGIHSFFSLFEFIWISFHKFRRIRAKAAAAAR